MASNPLARRSSSGAAAVAGLAADVTGLAAAVAGLAADVAGFAAATNGFRLTAAPPAASHGPPSRAPRLGGDLRPPAEQVETARLRAHSAETVSRTIRVMLRRAALKGLAADRSITRRRFPRG